MAKNNPHQLTRHHRRQKCHKGTDDPSNISIVPRYLHEAYHTLFKNMNTNQIANELNEVWIDPSFELVARKKQVPHTEQNF